MTTNIEPGRYRLRVLISVAAVALASLLGFLVLSDWSAAAPGDAASTEGAEIPSPERSSSVELAGGPADGSSSDRDGHERTEPAHAPTAPLIAMDVTPLDAERQDALGTALEALGLTVERLDLLVNRAIDPESPTGEVSQASMIDAAIIDPASGNLITFTLGQWIDRLPTEEIPFVEMYRSISIPGASQALTLANEESVQFIVVRDGGGPMIVATVTPYQPGQGDVLSAESVVRLREQVLPLLLDQE